MYLQEEQLITAAKKLGIKVTELYSEWKLPGVLFEYNNQKQIVINGTSYESLSRNSEIIMDNKYVCKQVLKHLNIPTPIGTYFSNLKLVEKEIKAFMEDHTDIKNWVCKPTDSTDGIGIRTEITDFETLMEHYLVSSDKFKSFILEEQIKGQDIRIQVINGELAAACIRKPAEVIGDGKSTLNELIKTKNIEISKHNPLNKIDIDNETSRFLYEQDIKLDTIVKKGKTIILKKVANISQGGTPIDITDSIHPGYNELIKKVSTYLKASIFSFDAISEDPSKDPLTNAKVIELNARPVWLHHTFSEVKTHDIATMILKSLFNIA